MKKMSACAEQVLLYLWDEHTKPSQALMNHFYGSMSITEYADAIKYLNKKGLLKRVRVGEKIHLTNDGLTEVARLRVGM
jgi:hypothetical protein